MLQITKADAKQRFEAHMRAGHHVNSQVMGIIESADDLFLCRIDSKEEYLSLIWQRPHEQTWPTPINKPRTLASVAERMIENGGTFASFTHEFAKSNVKHAEQSWFHVCALIDGDFRYDHFGLLVVIPAKEKVRQESPLGTYYLADGNHKAIVLAKQLMASEIEYRPVEALYCTTQKSD